MQIFTPQKFPFASDIQELPLRTNRPSAALAVCLSVGALSCTEPKCPWACVRHCILYVNIPRHSGWAAVLPDTLPSLLAVSHPPAEHSVSPCSALLPADSWTMEKAHHTSSQSRYRGGSWIPWEAVAAISRGGTVVRQCPVSPVQVPQVHPHHSTGALAAAPTAAWWNSTSGGPPGCHPPCVGNPLMSPAPASSSSWGDTMLLPPPWLPQPPFERCCAGKGNMQQNLVHQCSRPQSL